LKKAEAMGQTGGSGPAWAALALGSPGRPSCSPGKPAWYEALKNAQVPGWHRSYEAKEKTKLHKNDGIIL